MAKAKKLIDLAVEGGEQLAQEIRDLLFVHNTDARKLARQQAMGGMPNPSIAVTQRDIPFEGFGEISLIGRPESFDPSLRQNPLFSADAYTVRAPSPVRVANKNADRQFKSDYEAYRGFGNIDDVAYSLGDLESKSRIEPSDFRRVNDFLEYDNAAKLKFAEDNNIPVPRKENGDIDYYALSDVKSQNADKYEQWRQGEISKYFQPEEYFVTNPDYDRYSGRAKLQPYTAENVSKWMSKRAGAGQESTMTFGAGNVRASTTERIKSLEQARQMKGQLKSAEDMAEFKQTSDMMLGDLQDALKDYYQYDTNSFSYFDSVGEMIALSEKKGLKRAMEEVGFKDVPDELIKEIEGYKDYLRSAPTEYFESKPNRPVSLGEFGGAIVPEDTPQGLIDQLQREGLQVEKYTDEADRVAKRGAFENLMFTRPETVVGAGLLGAGVLGAMAPQKAEAGALNAGTKAMKKIAKEAMAGDMKAEEQLKEAIRAYHGSPYDFEQFMLENIGTGEGAQAYGWGLYFAQSPDVAKIYRDQLSPAPEFRVTDSTGYETTYPTNPYGVARDVADVFRNNDVETAKKIISDPNWIRSLPPYRRDAAKEIADDFSNYKNIEVSKTGKMYEVNLNASLDELLDFDKPFNEQSETVQSAIQKVLEIPYENSAMYRQLESKGFSKDDLDRYKEVYERRVNRVREGISDANVTGSQLYNRIADVMGTNQKEASEALSNVGVKGIRYDDAMSRGKEGGTSNYVVFDPRIIEIARKYGVALPVAASMLTAGLAPQEVQAGGLGLLDNLLKAGYPESVAKRIASGELPMDEASRAARRDAFGVDAYHLTNKDFNEFKLGGYDPEVSGEAVWMAPTKQESYPAAHNVHVPLGDPSKYAGILEQQAQAQMGGGRAGAIGARVMPLKVNIDNNLSVDEFNLKEMQDRWAGGSREFPYIITPETSQRLRDAGFDSILNEIGSWSDNYDVKDAEIISLDPNKIRSTSAAFDPEYTGPNILGSRVIPTAGLLAAGAMAPEDAEAGALSRLARAREQGFTQRAFMGVRDDMENITQLDPDVGMGARSNTGNWMAQNPIQAETYATQGTMPFRLNTQNYATVDFGGTNWNDRADFLELELPNGETVNVGGMDTNEIARTARELGVDGVQFEQITDLGPKSSKVDRQGLMDYYDSGDTQFAVFNPASARSEFAQFDPNKVGSRDILAARPEVIVPAGLITAAALAPDQVQAQELDPNLPLTIGSPKQEVNYETMPSYYDYGDGATFPVRPPEPVRETKQEYLPAGMPVNPYTFMMSQGATQGEAARTLADAYSEVARGAANAIGGFGGEMETLGKGLLFAITGGPMGGTPFSRFMSVLGNYNPQLPNTQDVSEIPALLPNISPMTEEERRMYRTAGEFLSPL